MGRETFSILLHYHRNGSGIGARSGMVLRTTFSHIGNRSIVRLGTNVPTTQQLYNRRSFWRSIGILLAFGMLFPNAPLFIIFIPIPIKAKYFVIFYGLLELFFGVSGSMSSVAHFAHLGGMLFGFFLIRYWKKKGIGGGGFYY